MAGAGESQGAASRGYCPAAKGSGSGLRLWCGHRRVGAAKQWPGGSLGSVPKRLGNGSASISTAERICGDALRLPFADEVFDLVFCQFTFLWLDAPGVIKEIRRVLQPQGVLVAIEPDYGGMIEYPPEIAVRDIWIAALTRAGADPFIGRKLPGLLQCPGWSVEVDLLDRLMPPLPERFALLGELPLTEEENNTLARIAAAEAALPESARLVHLPIFILSSQQTTESC